MNPSALVDQLIALPPAGRAIVVSTMLIGLAGIGAAVAWREAASLRHAVWLVALSAAVGVGILSFTGPTVRVEINPANRAPAPVIYNVTNIGTGIVRPQRPVADAPRPPQVAPAFAITASRLVQNLSLAVWAAGLLVILGRLIAGHLGIHRLKKSTREFPLGDVLASLIAGDMEIAAPSVRISDIVDGPFTIGMHGAVILLPAEAVTWNNERLRVVLLHEMAHVSRFDYLAQLIATIACAVYWFNPAVWLAANQLRAEAEQAADDRVLEAGIDGVTYATHLLELASRIGAPRLSTAVAVGMARSTRLERRFQSMLDSTRSRGNTPLRHQLFATAAIVGMMIPVVGFKAVSGGISAESGAPIVATAPAPASKPAPFALATGNTATRSDSLIEQTVNASAGEKISLDVRPGADITVHAWDQPQVRMRTLLSGNEVQDTRVTFGRVAGGVELRMTVDRSRRNSSNSNQIELWVPRRSDLQFSSGGGGIHIDGVEGRFTGQTGGGDITIRNARGEADLHTGGGGIRLTGDNLNGQVLTGGGNAVLNGVTGDVHVGSGGGTITRDGNQVGYMYGSGGYGYSSSRSAQSGGGSGYAYSRSGNSTVWANGTATTMPGQYGGAQGGGTSFSIGGGPIDLPSAPNGGSYTTGGGDIHVGSSAGMLVVTTGGGDVRLEGVSGDAVATTGAGQVQITVVNADGKAHNVSVASGSGKVIIDLPADIDARLDLESAYTERNGPTTIHSDFQINQTETQEWDRSQGTPRRYVRGTATLGSGRGLIRVKTVNGDVVIRRR
jgi:beta-lactamase regulating signal transducer with metallopeptidase domain/DUF4097 and DUF4098 domain-containing protein YvlB